MKNRAKRKRSKRMSHKKKEMKRSGYSHSHISDVEKKTEAVRICLQIREERV